MKWNKLGLVYCADSESDTMMHGGSAPVPLILDNKKVKVYFGSADKKGRENIYSLDLILKDHDFKISLVNKTPAVYLGDFGFFDDNGIRPSSVLVKDKKIFLYTIGFSIKNRNIFDAACGLAIANQLSSGFKKINGPIVDRSPDDPCFSCSPWVIFDNNIFKMWYVSCSQWVEKNGEWEHYYNIRYKESVDGIYWEVKSKPAIQFENEFEYAIARPCVIKDGESDYKMWYCYRGQKEIKTYRIGYAESKDGLVWERKDELAGIDVSASGWDSECICYPYVFDYNNERYMFYNGNGYGKSGFGLAILEHD